LDFLTPTSLLWFDPHLHIWKAKFLKALLICQQTFFPISKGGIGFISIDVIALNAYLGNLGACRPNHHIYVLTIQLPIFIGGYRVNSWGPLPFQTYLRWARGILPLIV
jgi:hypothetical protein